MITCIFFYEIDTNEVKGSYHDDCLKKTTTKKQQKKKHLLHICILNWGMAVMNYVKCRVSETSEENIFNV